MSDYMLVLSCKEKELTIKSVGLAVCLSVFIVGRGGRFNSNY